MAAPGQNNPAGAAQQAQAPAPVITPFATLPGRSERSEPSFDDTQPEELERYFEDLQALLNRYAVVDEQERKQAALKYLKIRTEQLWKMTEAWGDHTKTYDDFKSEVFALYPGATGDRTFTLQDLDTLIGHWARIGVITSTDLGEYYRKFLLISRYLIGKRRLSTQEQSRTFLRGLQPQLEAKVRQRLQQKFVDHFLDDPYELHVVYEAASYVLMGTSPVAPAPTQGTSPVAPSVPAQGTISPQDPTQVKLEALTAAITFLGEMFKTALQSQTQQAGAARPRNTGSSAAGTGGPSTSVCNFCGVPGHFIRECEIVEEFIRFGKCKRSPDGKVVLPSGAMVPRGIPGALMRDRIEEWHRLNPGQLAAMLFEVTATTATAPPMNASNQAYLGYPTSSAGQSTCVWPARTYALRRQLPPRPEVVITTLPPHRRGRVGASENASGGSSKEGPQGSRTESPPPAPEASSAAKKGKWVEFALEPTHPYAAAPDATYSATPEPARPAAREPAIGRPETNYHNTARVYDPQIAKSVYERAMETPITVTQRELLSLAPEVRTQMADATIRKRIPRDPAAQTANRTPVAHAMIEEVPDKDDPESTQKESTHVSHMPAAFAAAVRTPPPDATIIDDPYEAYLRENTGIADPTDSNTVVAAESSALRAILPMVDGQDKVEAILDPGCQIVAMSEEVCNALALHYDPTIRLNMMSANGGIDQSLGLARNIPFLVGDITLYLQVHILRNPAYDILLGRPFDVLTQSIVRNYPDENQTVTIIDPNTGKKATVSTIPRGSFRFADRHAKKCQVHSQDF